MKIAFLKNKNRNDSISIGASVIIQDLSDNGIQCAMCDYDSAFNFDVVMVSMTATIDLFDLYANMKRHRWDKRTFKSIIGGFGCQNPFALADFVDYAFFGRSENVISQVITKLAKGDDLNYPFITPLINPVPVILRQVTENYEKSVKYGKNSSNWTERFIGCRYRCKFCHYSYNRVPVGNNDTYVNDGISTGSPEIMLKDICKLETKPGRFTTALDGYSERLRFAFGKKISWDLVEEGIDHVMSFKGNTFIKLYNIHGFPTETEADVAEFYNFFQNYISSTEKADGLVNIEVLNTAFRPSLNTPMERMPARLFPEARYEDLRIAVGKGIIVKWSVNNSGAWSHLKDLISIRNTSKHLEMLDFAATDAKFNKLNDAAKLTEFVNRFDITDFIREYSSDEPFVSDNIDSGIKKKNAR